MAQDINVPVVTPNPIQFQPPTDLINGYLNRQQQGQQYDINQVGNLADSLIAQKQQRIQNQQAALAAHVLAIRQIGPDMANQIYGGNIQPNNGQPNTTMAPPAGGDGSGNAAGTYPQSSVNPGQTNPSSSSQGSPQTLGGNQPQPSQPSPYIQASLAAGHPDNTGYQQRIAGLSSQIPQYMNQGELGKEKIGEIQSQITALQDQQSAQKTSNDIAMQPAQAAKLNNDVSMLPTANAKAQQDLSNAQQQVPVEIGGKSAEVQKDYGAQDVKIQQGVKALQDLRDAWNAVPSKYKGPMIGQLTSRAGAGSSTLAPEVVKFNNAHANAATVLATALLPENARANPLMVEEVRKTIPTLAYGQKAFDDGISGFADQLKNNSNLNYQNHQSQAKAFGGNISQNQSQPQLPPVGGVYKGHIYLGGDPSKPTSWKAQ